MDVRVGGGLRRVVSVFVCVVIDLLNQNVHFRKHVSETSRSMVDVLDPCGVFCLFVLILESF